MRVVVASLLTFMGFVPALAATPPALVNYQGVLRDNTDKPLNGSYNMVFRFMDAAVAGNEIMVDQHAAVTSNAITVSGGLFNTALGSGTITDGTGPGTYTTLDAVFRDYGSVWLEVRIGVETLSPRTQVQSTAYALNSANAVSAVTATTSTDATQLGGQPPSHFIDTSTTAQSKSGSLGISSLNANDTALVGEDVASGGTGVYGSGGAYGGWFTATAGTAGIGVEGLGSRYGGLFYGTGSAYSAVYGNNGSGTGVSGYGSRGGDFSSGSGTHAMLATSDGFGINASGPGIYGGYFSNGAPDYSYAYIPQGSYGVLAYGSAAGGLFENFASGAYAIAGYSSYKVYGSGSVSFVQNHPTDPSKVIVYAAPEGDEVAVYTRGSGRLVGGEARLILGDTFALVANPDIGLTVSITPRGEWSDLYVVSVSTNELVVRSRTGKGNAAFDYIVWGLRIGFEEQSIVQPKRRDSKIPSMYQHEEFFAADPALRRSTALERFKGMQAAIDGRRDIDLSRAVKLRDAVGVFAYQEPRAELQPAFDGPTPPPGAPAVSRPASSAGQAATRPSAKELATATAPPPLEPRAAPAAPPFEFEVVEPIESGDVLALDPLLPGKLRRAVLPSDPNVAGIAERASADVDGVEKVAVVTSTYATVSVDAQFGAIHSGDLLVSSSTPGHAMVAKAALSGTVIGKALQPLESGTGVIRVLLLAR